MSWAADLLWRAQCRVNRELLRAVPGHPGTRFELRSGALDVLEPERSPGFESSLCIVITTHARVAPCSALIEQLRGQLGDAGIADAFLVVLEDPSSADYGSLDAVLARDFPGRFARYVAREHLGKRGFWSTYDAAFRACARAELSLFVQDDVQLVPHALPRMLQLWQALDDADKAVLYLCASADDEPDGRWTSFPRRDLGDGALRLTQWFDLQAFLAAPRLFATLERRVFPVPASRWDDHPLRSSGVGEQLTRRLRHRANVYQVRDTLVYHGGSESVMNPASRALRALDNRPAR